MKNACYFTERAFSYHRWIYRISWLKRNPKVYDVIMYLSRGLNNLRSKECLVFKRGHVREIVFIEGKFLNEYAEIVYHKLVADLWFW